MVLWNSEILLQASKETGIHTSISQNQNQDVKLFDACNEFSFPGEKILQCETEGL
jgi:hypothetical protein